MYFGKLVTLTPTSSLTLLISATSSLGRNGSWGGVLDLVGRVFGSRPIHCVMVEPLLTSLVWGPGE